MDLFRRTSLDECRRYVVLGEEDGEEKTCWSSSYNYNWRCSSRLMGKTSFWECGG